MRHLQLNPSGGRILTYAGLGIMTLPLYIYFLWIYSTVMFPDNGMALEKFRSLLPGFLDQIRLASMVSLLISVGGLVIGITGISIHVRCQRSNTVLIVLSGVLTFINLYQLL